MNRYEGMFIFPESLKDEVLQESVKHARGEIERLGGEVENVTRLGKRAFARVMKKHAAGIYVVITFRLAGDQLKALNNRFRLNDEIFRVSIVKARLPRAPAAAAAGEGA